MDVPGASTGQNTTGNRNRHSDTCHKGSVGRPKKKRYHGGGRKAGQNVQEETLPSGPEQEQPERPPSASKQKLHLSAKSAATDRRSKSPAAERSDGNRIVSWELFEKLSGLVTCKNCGGEIEFSEESARGLGFALVVKCSQDCGVLQSIDASPSFGVKKNGYDVNVRSVLAMRLIGQGRTNLQTFCYVMDLPTPVSQTAYDNIMNHLDRASEAVSEDSLNRAVQEEVSLTGSKDLSISGDGSWRRRGFISLHGVATAIGNKTGKTVDFVAKSAYCKECALWEKKVGTQEYEDWLEGHIYGCQANHEGSAGKMEVDAMVEIFKRSVEKHGVQYVNYIGDADTKTFAAVHKSNPYGAVEVKKKECVGHVEKRFGTHVRKVKENLKGQKLPDGKILTGQGRLTGKWIDDLQQYYGNAIRDNCHSVADMRNAIQATYFHYVSTDKNPQHQLCSKTWCKWQQAKENNTLRRFKHEHKLPVECMKALEKVYMDLSSPDLMERCLGGFTQNSNESLNNKIWSIVPKRTFSGFLTLKVGVQLAISLYNDGASASLDVLEELGITPGSNAINGACRADDQRVVRADKKALMSTLEARRKSRKERIQRKEQDEATEGALYEPGGF